jgi:hypothetical protein
VLKPDLPPRRGGAQRAPEDDGAAHQHAIPRGPQREAGPHADRLAIAVGGRPAHLVGPGEPVVGASTQRVDSEGNVALGVDSLRRESPPVLSERAPLERDLVAGRAAIQPALDSGVVPEPDDSGGRRDHGLGCGCLGARGARCETEDGNDAEERDGRARGGGQAHMRLLLPIGYGRCQRAGAPDRRSEALRSRDERGQTRPIRSRTAGDLSRSRRPPQARCGYA